MIDFVKRKIDGIHNMFIKKGGLSTDLSTIIPQRRSIITIIVHFGNKKDTEALVASLEQGTRPPDQIIVIDNDVKNCGYIAGLRAGVQKSRNAGYGPDDILVLLNNDIKIDSCFIAHIEAWWRRHGSQSVLAGPTLGSVSLVTGRARIGNQKPWGAFRRTYIHGACMVLERSLFDEISDLGHLFMYWEDVAMSFHVSSLKGWVRRIPGLAIVHDDAIHEIPDRKLYYLVRNGAYVLERMEVPWGMYWWVVNSIRYAYHRARKHGVVADALRDRKYVL